VTSWYVRMVECSDDAAAVMTLLCAGGARRGPGGGAAASARAAVRRRQLKKCLLVTPADHWPNVDSGISMKQSGAPGCGSTDCTSSA
jgi:hypothetical protein